MPSTRARRRTARVVGVVVTALAAATLAAGATVWAHQPAGDQRLLAGTRIGAVDVGGDTAEQARRAVADHLADELAEPIAVSVDGRRVATVTPAELGAEADVDAAVHRARTHGTEASAPRRALARLAPGLAGAEVTVPVAVDEARARAVAEELAAEVDDEPADAAVAWRDGGLTIIPGEAGTALDVDRAAHQLTQAAADRAAQVALSTRPAEPAVTEADIAAVADELTAAAEAAARRTVTVDGPERAWEVTGVDVGATPDVGAALEAALTGDGDGVTVPATVDRAALRQQIAAIADDVDVAAQPAQLDTSGGGLTIVEARPGRQIRREEAATAVAEAFAEGRERVELPVEPVTADRTRDDYRHVLVVRQAERRLSHYVDGQRTRSWPVAVGGGDSPTPTGEFVVGAKRHRPTWVNPAPNGWGSDMPERIGPGRDNPLGLRALDWHRRGGGDTLIRFHGTAVESSIGTAASQGCVRLTNDDVVELYQRVPVGATIVSVRS